MKRHMRFALSLREEPFFRAMSDALLEKMEGFVFHREYEPRQIIRFPDDPWDYVYWVREGRVKITRKSGDGRELTLRHLVPGDMIGEECILSGAERDTYAEAMTPTILCLIRSGDFRRIAREEAELSLRIAQRLCQRVAEAEQALADIVFRPVRCRVASGLLRLCKKMPRNEPVILRLTHQEIGNFVGATRETTTAVLHELKKEGILTIGNRRLTVLDLVALEHEAGGRG